MTGFGEKGMLIGFLEKALAIGCDSIEIEYKDRQEWVTAFWDRVGYGIGCLDRDEAKPMFKEMDDLKRKKRVTIGGATYRLVFSRYESFGEWVFRIQMKMDKRRALGAHRGPSLA
jgi:hypothetical protein